MLRPLPTETERDRDRVLADERDTGALERHRLPPSRRERLEKEGWRPTEDPRTDRLEFMISAVYVG